MRRSTFTLTPKVEAMLKKIACAEGITKNEVVRRAIALYDVLYDERQENREILVRDRATKKIKKEIIFT